MLELDAETIYRHLAQRARETFVGETLKLVGVHTGGVWLAERLKRDLKIADPVGILDVSFYRDDFDQSGLKPAVRPSQIAFDVAGSHILLVDDVLNTGRTVRAAMNEIFDYGRPARVDLAVLIDRGGRELPIAASIVGATIELPADVAVVLVRDDDAQLHLTMEKRGD
ncbi:MAG: bifunctional pyr operon transcriptional regulator/uracil phosphoribosyltransferase PyrR [Betaproteobacteria bacterium]|jgi:pyrimidine operon attenuation protein/uracil phosphoribosyltransferase|nr:bifunctional pyr operon transcriptional regulator/uracil phosphoribosyltransferase PyrR [Betaproteobacteria bacterium]MDH5209917.1 bifunctional pyr operon transcriptional regulator/uracil phosphoribosyltransferase PyrR [Burkholderiaceae bacterium]